MTIDLAKDVEDFISEKTRAGTGVNANQLVNDLLRSVLEQQKRPFELTPELENWLLQAADSPHTTLTAVDFNTIRQRKSNGVQSKKS